MNDKIAKHVLVGDDELPWHDIFRQHFLQLNEELDCPYSFEVDTATCGIECLQKIRVARRPYDVIVLDIRMEQELAGIRTARAVEEEFRAARPIIIIFTGHPEYETCVEAMRHGAWDYIVKESSGNRGAEMVLNSAVERLRELDLREQLQTSITENWLPQNIWRLRQEYPNKVIAIWHEPNVGIIGSGNDAFELEEEIKNWREQHESWENPFFIKIPVHDSVSVGE